jgi:hypothetical protein
MRYNSTKLRAGETMQKTINCHICETPTKTNLCTRCQTRTRNQLNEIIKYTTIATTELQPTQNGDGRTTEQSVGINLDALDLITGNDVLPILESWETMYRHEWGYTPLGPVTLKRATNQTNQPLAQLAGCITFLKHHLDRIATHDTATDFSHEIASCWYQARNAARRQPRHAWRVTCPTDTNTGECGNTLRITGQDFGQEITCKKCQTLWPTDRLLHVVATSTEAEIWVDTEAAARHTGVPESTLRRWGKTGKIKRKGSLYEYKSLNKIITTTTTT